MFFDVHLLYDIVLGNDPRGGGQFFVSDGFSKSIQPTEYLQVLRKRLYWYYPDGPATGSILQPLAESHARTAGVT